VVEAVSQIAEVGDSSCRLVGSICLYYHSTTLVNYIIARLKRQAARRI
jgi:hypothetical protein